MDYIIEMLNITKTFPGIVANDNVNLLIKKGEIHALLGENGAGKSTLMSILFGMYQPDKGEIRLEGKPVKIKDPNEANRLGIGMVHQHFKLVGNFTVLENIVLGAEDTKMGVLQLKEAREKVLALSELYQLKVDPDAKIDDITVGMQQRVEILKMLYRDNDILIFDEPTAVLTPQEIEELIKIMRKLAQEGKSLIFITHKLNEIKQVADRCTILRKGKYIDTVDVSKTSAEEMSEMMVGRKVALQVAKEDMTPGEAILSVRDLCLKTDKTGKNKLNNISFDVRKNEILCIAGIDGNGQTELAYALTGMMPISSGSITLKGEDISKASIRQRSVKGMSHIPEDRHKDGLVLEYSLEENLILQEYFTDQFQNKGFLKFDKIREFANTLIDQFDIRSGQGAQTTVRSMSGGNQQKAIIAREITKDPDLLVAVQPTRGLDVGAIEYIHSKIVEQRDNGKAVLLISLELDEVMNLSDRILVIYEGEIVGEFDPRQVDVKELGLYMAGSKRAEVK
ncbi:MAG: ABC transporter ATP-binding protein [Anaerofustis stercorihominis]|nr:ABC transporter ATP-binding protein [Anaerofustis stercorihominis]